MRWHQLNIGIGLWSRNAQSLYMRQILRNQAVISTPKIVPLQRKLTGDIDALLCVAASFWVRPVICLMKISEQTIRKWMLCSLIFKNKLHSVAEEEHCPAGLSVLVSLTTNHSTWLITTVWHPEHNRRQHQGQQCCLWHNNMDSACNRLTYPSPEDHQCVGYYHVL